MKNPQVLIIDTLSMCFRGYHGMAGRPGSDISATGRASAAIVGFINYAVHLHTLFPEAIVLLAYETGKSERRVRIHPEYKSNRSERPEEFNQQLAFLRRLWDVWPARLMELPGMEADDLVAAATVEAKEANTQTEVFIASSDKDFAVLLSIPGVTLMRPGTGSMQWDRMDAAKAKAKWGITPHNFTQYLALTGDKSDGFNGIDKVGPKTAAKLLDDYGSLANIWQAVQCGAVRPTGLQERLHRDWSLVERNLQLAEFDNITEPVLVEDEQIWIQRGWAGEVPLRGDYVACSKLLAEWGLSGHFSKLKRIPAFAD